MHRIVMLAYAIALAMSQPVAAQEVDMFQIGNVFCSNYDDLSQTCRSISTVTRRDGQVIRSRGIRRIALPETNVLMTTEGNARVDGLWLCGVGPVFKPSITPADNLYADALITVYERKRDFRLARGICAEYRPCGSGYNVYLDHDGLDLAKLMSLTTVFEKGDPRIAALTLRDQTFGVPEVPPSDCEPLG